MESSFDSSPSWTGVEIVDLVIGESKAVYGWNLVGKKIEDAVDATKGKSGDTAQKKKNKKSKKAATAESSTETVPETVVDKPVIPPSVPAVSKSSPVKVAPFLAAESSEPFKVVQRTVFDIFYAPLVVEESKLDMSVTSTEDDGWQMVGTGKNPPIVTLANGDGAKKKKKKNKKKKSSSAAT